MDADHLLPVWTGLASLVLIVNNFLSYSGMEMNAVHVGSLKNPAKEFPKSMFLAMGLVLLIFILPALAISWVVPAEELQPHGRCHAGLRRGLRLLRRAVAHPDRRASCSCAASLGGMLTWLAGPSKGLLLISRRRATFRRSCRSSTSTASSRTSSWRRASSRRSSPLLYAFIPNVSSAYWIFSVITTQVYLIMYLLMFVAAMRLRRNDPDHPRGYKAPSSASLCGVGFVASLAALLIGFVPPSQFGGGSPRRIC